MGKSFVNEKKREIVIVGIILLLAIIVDVSYTGNSTLGDLNYNFDDVPNEFEIEKGKEFFMNIDIGEGYTFSDDTDLFDINETSGVINFIPDKTGEFYVNIIVLKNIEDFRFKLIKINVIE